MRSLGPYEVVREIARGGMGVVYLARHRLTGQEVALKSLLVGDAASEEQLERFLREARACTRLRHPNIVSVHDVGEHEGRHYFTMDVIDGVTLAELLRGLHEVDTASANLGEVVSRVAAGREHLSAVATLDAGEGTRPAPSRAPAAEQRPCARPIAGLLPLTQVLVLMVKIIRAVQHAHERGIIHRDLKPSNVMVDRDGEPVVMDFGLARLVEGVTLAEATRTGQVVGTPRYMAPEQALGQRELVDERSDVYSLAVILYELLTGCPVVEPSGQLVLELLRVVESEPLPPRRLNPRLPREVETIVLKALDKDPARRYVSAQAMADDLERFLGGDPISARPPTFSYVLRKKLVKHRRPVVLAAVMAVTLASVAAWGVRMYVQQWAGWELAFEDRFDGGRLDPRWRVVEGSWKVVDGELEGAAHDNGYLILDLPIIADVRLELDVRCLEDSRYPLLEAALLCNASPGRLEGDGYFASLGDQDGVKLQRCGLNVFCDPAVRPEPGRWHLLRLERVGRRLALLVDGDEVATYQDPIPVTGSLGRDRVGLYLYAARTRFDNLRLWSRGAALVVSVLEKGNVLFDRGLFAEAAQEYAVVRRTRPGSSAAWEATYREGMCHLELARATTPAPLSSPSAELAEALAAAEERLAEVREGAAPPLAQFAQAALAEVTYLRGDPAAALELALAGADRDPILRAAIRPLLGRSGELATAGMAAALASYTDAAARLYPHDARLVSMGWMMRGFSCRANGEMELAVDLFQRVHRNYLRHQSYAAWSLWELARSQAMMGRVEESLAVFERVLRDCPDEHSYCSAALVGAAASHALLGSRQRVGEALARCARDYPEQQLAAETAAVLAAEGTPPAGWQAGGEGSDRHHVALFLTALAALSAGDEPRARRLLGDCRTATPDKDPTLWPVWETEALLAVMD